MFTDMAKKEMKDDDDLYHRREDCYQPDAKMNFLTRSFCQKHISLDKRTPEFFKYGRMGTEMICLNSKTYCAFNEQNKKNEDGFKGQQQGPGIASRKAPVRLVRQGSNKGFRYNKRKMFTPKQKKTQ